MKVETKKKQQNNQSGAALVTVLMMSLILLVAAAGLILEASMNSANATDALAEQQAYVAAESGIQSVINVLRGNVTPSVLLDSSANSTAPVNLINFTRALKTASSNLPGDSSSVPRLSRWLSYNSTYNDRITMGSSYAPRTGFAYGIELSDPDATGDSITFSTTGKIDGTANTKTYGSGANTVTFTYTPRSTTTLTITGDTVNTNLGSFTISATGTGYTFTDDVRFEIVVAATDPYEGVKVVRGLFAVPRDGSGNKLSTTVTPSSVGSLKINYDSSMYVVIGSVITVTGLTSSSNPIGAGLTPVIGVNTINCTMSAAEPLRVLVKATGYGPRGAKKVLEAIVQKNFFNGMQAPATLTLVGSSTGFVFVPGQSQNVTYSGDDMASSVIIPPVGTDNDNNLNTVNTAFSTTGRKADVFGIPSNVSAELPSWLWSPRNLDATIQNLRNVAKSSGNYYTSGDGPDTPGNYATGKGITFMDGDYRVRADGGGILIVTGKLTLNGAFSFKGLIIVTGSGGVDRNGGGNGLIQGNMVIAPYNPSNLNLPFLPPKYDMSGGGTSELRYDSNSVANGMTAVSNFVLGVAEK